MSIMNGQNINIDPPAPITIEVPQLGVDGRSVHPVGEWSEEETYIYLNLVTYEGSSYIAIVTEVPAGTLPTDTEYWQLAAERGQDGDLLNPVDYDTQVTNKIEKATIAPVETADTASRDYSEGEFIIYKNLFYKVTADITEGDEFEEDTNITETSIAEQLTQLMALVNH